jgi:hypothetical protein
LLRSKVYFSNSYLRIIGQPMGQLLAYGAFAIIALVLLAANAHAQDLEPRSYTNTPVGLNFLLAGYGYSEGKIAFDPSLSLANGQFRTNTEQFAYVRALDVFGMSGKFDVFVPYSEFSGHAVVSGQAIEREMSGFNEPRFRFSIKLLRCAGAVSKGVCELPPRSNYWSKLAGDAAARAIR